MSAPLSQPALPTALDATGLDRRPSRPLWVARVSGDQVTMGRQHAALLREAGGWENLVDYYSRMPELVIGGPRDGDRVPARVLALRPLVALASRALEGRRPKDFRARSRAFFRELGLPPETSRFMGCMDVMQNVINLAGRFGHGPSQAICARAVPACTSLAVWGEGSASGELLHARNFDFPGVGLWERNPAVVFCEPSDGLRYGFVATRGADVPVVTVFNEAGLCLTSHTRFHRDFHMFSGAGVVDLVHEIVANARTLADAARIARRRQVSSTWGLLVSSREEGRAVALEVTGRGVEVVEAAAGESFLAVANRYASTMRSGQVSPSAGFLQNSDGRYANARAWGARGGLGVGDLQDMLASFEDPDVCEAKRSAGGVIAQALTVHSVVLQPSAEAVHVSVGPVPTGQGPYVTIPWRWSKEPEAEVIEAPEAPARDESPEARAYEWYLEATRLQGAGGTHAGVEDALLKAVEAAPEDATYRLLAGAYALRRREPREAREHFRRGLEHERAGFHRGQLLLWASRAASLTGDAQAASALRQELRELEGPFLDDYQAAAQREERRAFSRRNLGRIEISAGFPDVFVG